jgi:cell division protein FtsN
MKSLQRGGFVVGLVVGLLIGLGVALGVALYVTKAPIPFINKVPQRSAEQDAAEAERNKHWDPNAPLAGKNPARPAAVASGAVDGTAPPAVPDAPLATAPAVLTAPAGALPRSPAAASAADTSRGGRDPAALLSGQSPAPPAPAASAAAAARAATRAASVAGVAGGTGVATMPVAAFFVQAGAYARPDDADAQRAKLAMMGLSARITEREQAGRTVYRVRLGPFDGRETAEDAQAKLAAGGIEANLVRVER